MLGMGISMNIYPLVMTNIAMENCPFLDGLPMKIAWATYTMANCECHNYRAYKMV